MTYGELMERNFMNELKLRQLDKLFNAAWKERGFLLAQLGKTLEERNALEKELEEAKAEVQKWKEIADCVYSRPVSDIKWVNSYFLTEMAKENEKLKGELASTEGQLWEQKKELEALKEAYHRLAGRFNQTIGKQQDFDFEEAQPWKWPQEPTRSSSSRSMTSTMQQDLPSASKEASSPSGSSSPGTGDS